MSSKNIDYLKTFLNVLNNVRSAKYNDHEAIPFCFSLGYLQVCVHPEALDVIQGKSAIQISGNPPSSTILILFGSCKKPSVNVTNAFNFHKLELNGDYYGCPDSEFLGFAFKEEITDVNISFIKTILKDTKRSLVLLQPSLTTEDSIIGYECVFDVQYSSLEERIMMVELYKCPKEGNIRKKNPEALKKLVFYTGRSECGYAGSGDRFPLQGLKNVTSQRYECHTDDNPFLKYKEEIMKSAEEKKIIIEDIKSLLHKGFDYLLLRRKFIMQTVQQICSDLNIEVTYEFIIFKDQVLCCGNALSYSIVVSGNTMQGTQVKVALDILLQMLDL